MEVRRRLQKARNGKGRMGFFLFALRRALDGSFLISRRRHTFIRQNDFQNTGEKGDHGVVDSLVEGALEQVGVGPTVFEW